MLGAILGDIVGSRWEFNPTNDYNFEWLSPENTFTDDTICTIAIADALQCNRSFADSLREWCLRYPNPMGGYGIRFSQWLNSNNPSPLNSFGNGAAMRVSPVAYWFDDEKSVLQAAAETAMPTHNHPEGIKGAQTVALAIFKARQFSKYKYQNAVHHIDDIIHDCIEFSGYDINIPRFSVQNKFDETCQGTVPVALKIISLSANYEDAVRLAVSLGADADTLGAIVGSIAESIWGIPLNLSSDVEDYLPAEMNMVLDQFQFIKPKYFKSCIDTTYGGSDYSNASWDFLYDLEGKEGYDEIRKQTVLEKIANRKKMAERAKARKNW